MLSENHIKTGIIPNDKLRKLVVKFFKDNEVTCKETIYQSDRAIENAYSFLEVLFDEVKEELKEPCDSCSKKVLERDTITLNGTDDFYNLDVCDECYDRLSDVYTPEQVDRLMGVK